MDWWIELLLAVDIVNMEVVSRCLTWIEFERTVFVGVWAPYRHTQSQWWKQTALIFKLHYFVLPQGIAVFWQMLIWQVKHVICLGLFFSLLSNCIFYERRKGSILLLYWFIFVHRFNSFWSTKSVTQTHVSFWKYSYTNKGLFLYLHYHIQ